MSEGFSEEKIDVAINKDEVKNLLKKYKKIKKIYEVSTVHCKNDGWYRKNR